MVLLRNEPASSGVVLPLDPTEITTVAVVGPNADPGIIQGGGSAELPAHHVTSPVAGLGDVFAAVDHHPGCRRDRYLPLVPIEQWASDHNGAPLRHEIFAGDDFGAEPVIVRSSRSIHTLVAGGIDGLPDPLRWSQRWTGTLRIDEAGRHQFSVFAIGPSRVFVDGSLVVDNWADIERGDGFFQKATPELVGELDLETGTVEIVVEWTRNDDPQLGGVRFGWLPPTDDERLMTEAVAAAGRADAAVVVVGLDADWESESHDRAMFGLPGRQDELVRKVAAANPRTVVVVNAGGPVDLPWLDDVPAAVMAWYPGQEFGGALADVLTGAADPSGRLPVTFPMRLEDTPTHLDIPGDDDQLHYRDGLFVGHRWYDARGIEPRREFGFGLSYAEFDIGEPVVDDRGSRGVAVTVPVANRSDRGGTCVLQLYLEAPSGPATRPLRSLAGFVSVGLEPGARRDVTIDVAPRAFEIWRSDIGWHTPAGRYVLRLGTSSRRLLGSVAVDR